MSVQRRQGTNNGWSHGAVCPACGTRTLQKARVPYEVTFRDRAYTVPDAEVMQCESCGEIFFAPGQSDALQRAASDRARKEMGLLTGTEIASFRNTLGLTQTRLETALGVPAKTVARWEVGSVLQSRAADRFLRLLIAHSELLTELLRERDNEATAVGAVGDVT